MFILLLYNLKENSQQSKIALKCFTSTIVVDIFNQKNNLSNIFSIFLLRLSTLIYGKVIEIYKKENPY